MSHNRTFIIQFLCFHKSIWEQNHIVPGIYIVNHAYVIKFIKMTNIIKTHSRQETQEYETVVFQKNRYKILTYTNPSEQNNNDIRISHEIEFRSSFNVTERNFYSQWENDRPLLLSTEQYSWGCTTGLYHCTSYFHIMLHL